MINFHQLTAHLQRGVVAIKVKKVKLYRVDGLGQIREWLPS